MAIVLVPFVVTPVRAQIVEKKSLDLSGAKKAIAAAADYAKKNNAPGGVIAVVDEGGNLMALERLDGTFAMGATISIGKARTAVLFKKPTRFFEELINKGRTAMTAVNGFTPLIGGIPIVVDGQVVGGIGVSGAASANQDEELALAGANAVAVAGRAEAGLHEGTDQRVLPGSTPPATALGARISPRKNPANNPHMWAGMLTSGVERSNAIWITTMRPMFASCCLACGAS